MSHGRHPRPGLASAGSLRASLGAAPGGGGDGGMGPGPGSMDGVAGGPGGAAEDDGYLTGQFLVAMPSMTDSRFEKSVIYVCAHSEEGAMGIVINQQLNQVRFADLLEQLDIAALPSLRDRPVLFGGPVETGRGFVLHSLDVMTDETLAVEEAGSGEATIGLTGTLEMLRAVASGAGPDRAIFALGYAGWAPGQLDAEIQANGWLTARADPAIVFDPDLEAKWARVMAMLGIDPALLSVEAGHA